MNNHILLDYDEKAGVLTSDQDKIIICYIESKEELRVIRTSDKELLKKEHFEFNLSEFIAKIKTYSNIINRK